MPIDASFRIIEIIITLWQGNWLSRCCYFRNHLQLRLLRLVKNSIVFIKVNNMRVFVVCLIFDTWRRSLYKVKCFFFSNSAINLILILIDIIILLDLWFFSITQLISLWATGTICIEVTVMLIDGIDTFRTAHHQIRSVQSTFLREVRIDVRRILLLEFLLRL